MKFNFNNCDEPCNTTTLSSKTHWTRQRHGNVNQNW